MSFLASYRFNEMIYNNKMKIIFRVIVILFLSSCSKVKGEQTQIINLIDSIHVKNVEVAEIDINNNAKIVTLTFYNDDEVNDIDLLFFLGDNVSLMNSTDSKLSFNIHSSNSFQLLIEDMIMEYNLDIKFVPRPYHQSSFVISTFHGVPGFPTADYHKILENTKLANFSHFETTFTTSPGNLLALQIAEDLDLKVIVQDYSRFGGFQNYNEQIANTTISSVEEAKELYGKYSSFAGYYVWDEPFIEQLPQVKRDLDFLRKIDPDKIFLIVTLQSYSPTYTWENGQYIKYIDTLLSRVRPPILCTNYYIFEQDIKQGTKLEDSKLWKDWGFIRKKAMEQKIPFWLYIQMMGDILKGEVGKITVDEIAVQNYIALALGAKGISYYNTINGIFDEHGTPNHLFEGVRELNRETMLIGNVLLNASSSLVYSTQFILHGDYLNNIQDSDLVDNAPSKLFIGEFKDAIENNDLILVVNLDYKESNSGVIELKKTKDLFTVDERIGKKEVIKEKSNSIHFDLLPGRGKLYILK